MQLNRRNLLIGVAAGGGLLAAFSLLPRSYAPPVPAGPDETAFDSWIKIARDGTVHVAVPQLEMGQGITTLLPQIVAVELGADWRQMAVEPAPVSAAYANPVLAARWQAMWQASLSPGRLVGAGDPESSFVRQYAEDNRFQVTADGTSIAAYEAPLRLAAAGVRCLLAKAAAGRWGVDWQDCEAKDGFILHAASKRRLRFADLAQAAADETLPDPVPLRAEPAAERQADFAAGARPAFPRLDLPAKVDGSYPFAADIRLPDMVYAAIAHGPPGDATLAKFDAAATRGIAGLIAILRNKRWLAAVASNSWAAEQALRVMQPSFRVKGKLVDSIAIEAALDKALRSGAPVAMHAVGDVGALRAAKASLIARYDVAPAHAASIETASATARFANGRLELWIASQAPEAARLAAAGALGIDVDEVVLYPLGAGGSFDARLEHEIAAQVAVLARRLARPVQLTWSRHQEMLRSRPRAPAAVRMAAVTVQNGGIAGLWTRIATPSSGKEFGNRLLDGKPAHLARKQQANGGDALAVEGAGVAYAIPNQAVDHVPTAITLPTGRVRGNAHAITAFATESFIDELARKAGREPLSFRVEMLGNDLALARCLTGAATLAGWDGGADSSGMGLACHRIGAGAIAVIVTARRDERGLRVSQITAVAEIGRVINLDIARQQIEGGLVFGLGLAMGGAASYANGLPASSRLAALTLPHMVDCPEIQVELLASSGSPADPGELGAVTVAPAIANALQSATGMRFRRLPLFSEGL